MTEGVALALPADFSERCRAVNARIEAGEPMTMQNIADELGIPFEFFAGALAMYVELELGVPTVIDLSPAPNAH